MMTRWSIRFTTPEGNTMQRVGNSAIMDLVMTSGRFTSAEVKKLIYCRMYLKAITLSDLTTIRGNRLGMVKTQGAISLTFSKTASPFFFKSDPHQKNHGYFVGSALTGYGARSMVRYTHLSDRGKLIFTTCCSMNTLCTQRKCDCGSVTTKRFWYAIGWTTTNMQNQILVQESIDGKSQDMRSQ